jgi:hypothetical protein
MKKSILWIAAGAVTATAIWAAVSLPQRSPAPDHAPLVRTESERFSPPPGASLADRQAFLLIDYPSGDPPPFIPRTAGQPVPTEVRTTLSLSLRPSQTFHWDGNEATVTQDTGVERFPLLPDKTGRPVTLTITRQFSEKDATSWMRRSTSYSRTIQPGETFEL